MFKLRILFEWINKFLDWSTLLYNLLRSYKKRKNFCLAKNIYKRNEMSVCLLIVYV